MFKSIPISMPIALPKESCMAALGMSQLISRAMHPINGSEFVEFVPPSRTPTQHELQCQTFPKRGPKRQPKRGQVPCQRRMGKANLGINLGHHRGGKTMQDSPLKIFGTHRCGLGIVWASFGPSFGHRLGIVLCCRFNVPLFNLGAGALIVVGLPSARCCAH